MRRCMTIALLAGALAGCQLHDDQKVEAYKRWHQARARVIYSVGTEHLKVGDLDRADTCALEALKLDPEFLPARLLRAKALLEKGQYAAAEEELLAAEKLSPADPEIPYLMGTALEKRREHLEALRCYQKARALDPSNHAYVTASAEVLVALGKPREALDLLAARLQQGEEDPSVLALAGELATLVGDHAAAAGYYQRCVDIEPASLPMQENLAKSLFFAGEYPEALTVLEQLAAHPDYRRKVAWVYVMSGDSHMAMSEPGPAKNAYETAATLQPGAAQVWLRLAKAAMAIGEPSRAMLAARQALALGQECLEATIVLGYALLREGRASDAAAVLAEAARKHPDDATLLCMLGRCYAAQGQEDRALACYQRVLESDPKHPLAQSLLAAGQATPGPLPPERGSR